MPTEGVRRRILRAWSFSWKCGHELCHTISSSYPGRGDRDRPSVRTDDIDGLIEFGAVLCNRSLNGRCLIKHELPSKILTILAREAQGLLEPFCLRASHWMFRV